MSILKDKRDLIQSFIESVTGDDSNAAAAQSTGQVASSSKPALDRDVEDLLLSDLETKVLEILQEAKKVMRHSKRHVLTTQDVDASFKKLTIKVSRVYMSFANNFTLVGNLWVPVLRALRLPEGPS